MNDWWALVSGACDCDDQQMTCDGILLVVPATGGEYLDDRCTVALHYLKGMFLFDCVTSFPVSFFELVAKANMSAPARVMIKSLLHPKVHEDCVVSLK